MRRSMWMIVTLVVVVGWLVLAYIPSLRLPQFALPAWMGAPLALLAAVGLVTFLVIQAILVGSTDQFMRKAEQARRGGGMRVITAELNLRRGREVFWTSLPLLMTLALAQMAWSLWSALV